MMPMHEDYHLDETVLHGYLDDVLDPTQRSEVEAHIAGCPLCSHRLQELGELFLSLTSLADVPLERDLVPSVMSIIRQRKRYFPVLKFAIATQILTVGFLFIWPHMSAAIDEIIASPLTTRFTAETIGVFTNVSRIWSVVLDALTGFLTRGLINLRNVPSFSWPVLDEWLVVVVMVVIWLVGNGLLLRVTQSDRRSRLHQDVVE